MAGNDWSFGGSSSGSSSNDWSFGSSAPAPALSPTQIAEVRAAKAKSGSKSLLGEIESTPGHIFHKSGSFLGTVLNYISRPAAAVDTGLTMGVQAGDKWNLKTLEAFGHGFKLGITGKSHDTFSDYIRAKFPKFAAHHKTATAIGGLAGTILTDPTLPLILGAQVVPGVNVGVDELTAARLAKALATAETSTERANQAQATIDAINKVVGTATSHSFSERKALAEAELTQAQMEMAGKPVDFVHMTRLVAAREGARVEAEQGTKKLLQAQYSIPFSGGKTIPLTPTYILGRRVAPALPSLASTAARGIPGVSRVAQGLGEAFKHGFGQEQFAKPALAVSTKAKQFVADSLFRMAHLRVGPYFQSMNEKDIRKALDYGETHHGLVRAGRNGRTLNEKMLARAERHGEITSHQAGFIREWHHVMEHMRQQEIAFGVHHEGDIGDILYVPHRYLRTGGTITRTDLRNNFGLEKARQNLTLANLEAAKATGSAGAKGLELVTNPAEMLGRRIQESADASTQRALAQHLAAAAGVPAKIPDLLRRSKALGRVRSLKAKQRALTHIQNTRGTRISLGRRFQIMADKAVEAVHAKHQPKLDAIDAQITHHMEQAGKAAPITPSFSTARGMTQKALKEAIAHFTPQDRVQAVRLHGLMAEGKRLEGKWKRLGAPKGGSQKGFRTLAAEVEQYAHTIEHLHGLSAAEVENLGRDVSKENIRYTAQPQGKMSTIKPEEPKFSGRKFAPSRRGESWRGNTKIGLDAARESLAKEYKALTRKYTGGKAAFDHGKAIKRLVAQRERVMAHAAADIERAHEKIRVKRVAAEEEWQKTFDRQARLFTNYQRQIEKEQRAYAAMKNNPDVPAGWLKFEKWKIGNTYHYFNPDIHDALMHMERAINNRGVMQSIGNAWRNLMRSWKIGVTSVNPGYRVRNTASDVWNMYIAGVPTPRIVQYGKRAAHIQVLAHRAGEKLARGDKNLTENEIASLRALAEMQLHGILSGLFQGDIQEVSRMFHAGTRARDYIQGINPVSLGKAYVKATQDWNRHIENWGRVTHYLYRRQYQHMSPADAAAWVKKAHFDYEELTPFEQERLKQFFPFYTWTRKNIPYQLSQLASRPGKYATFAHMVQTSNELATGNPHTPEPQPALLPDWMRQNYMFRVPGFGANAYVNPNIGVQDLSDLEHPITHGIAQHMNPVAQVLAAVVTGKNPGTQQDIVGSHPRNPVSGLGADILRLIPGSNVGPTERTVRGKLVQGEGANPWFTYAAQQLPLLNTLINQESNIKKAERGGGNLPALGYLSGLSVYNRDLSAEQTAAELDFEDKMKRIIRGLRDTGQLPQTQPKRLSPFQAALDQLIIKNGG